MTQISNMKVIGLMIVFFKNHQSLAFFYGVWQKVATYHRAQYLTVKVR